MSLQEHIEANIGAVYLAATGKPLSTYAWSMDRLAGGMTNSGVYRLRLAGDVGEWSVILKVTGMPDKMLAVGDWHREVDAYRSGCLAELAPGLRAPHCYRIDAQVDGSTLLWLEDVHEAQPTWSLSDYSKAAHELGRFNGAYLAGRPKPDAAWLSRRWLRTQIEPSGAFLTPLLENRDQPLVRRAFPPDVIDFFMSSWTERELYLSVLERLPQTLCHMDAFKRNLFWSPTSDYGSELVAIDWSFIGEGAAGVELVPLIGATVGFGEVVLDDLARLEAATYHAYLDGLHAVGWRGRDDEVWLAYAADAALRYGVGTLWFLLPLLLEQGKSVHVQEPSDAASDRADHWCACIRQISIRLAHETRRTLR